MKANDLRWLAGVFDSKGYCVYQQSTDGYIRGLRVDSTEPTLLVEVAFIAGGSITQHTENSYVWHRGTSNNLGGLARSIARYTRIKKQTDQLLLISRSSRAFRDLRGMTDKQRLNELARRDKFEHELRMIRAQV